MLDVVSVPVSGQQGSVECWMDIQRGQYPNVRYFPSFCRLLIFFIQVSPIENVIKIGETLTILVYLRDQEGKYDISVRDCWAYDSEDYAGRDTSKLQLTDASGCPKYGFL